MQKTPRADSNSKCASVWFMRLELAKQSNDFAAAAEAQQRLKELGITVRYKRQPKQGEVVSC